MSSVSASSAGKPWRLVYGMFTGLERQTELKSQTSLNTSSGIWGRATPGLLRSSPAWRGVSEICLGPENRGCENFSISHTQTKMSLINQIIQFALECSFADYLL